MKPIHTTICLITFCLAATMVCCQTNNTNTSQQVSQYGIIITSSASPKKVLYKSFSDSDRSIKKNIPGITQKAEGGFCDLKASFTPSNDSTVVSGFNVHFVCTTPNVTAKWTVNDVYSFSGNEFSYSAGFAGIYEIKLVVEKDGCTDTAKCYYTVEGKADYNTNFFRMSYGLDKLQTFPRSFDTINTGGFIMAGYSFTQGFNAAPRGLLIKTTNTNCIEWSKLITSTDNYGEYYPTSILSLKNNDFLVFGGTNILTRFTSNGDAKWSRSYITQDGSRLLIHSFFEADDGKIYCSAYNSDQLTGYVILCLSSTGDVIWSKYISQFANDRSSAAQLLASGNDLYMCGYLKKSEAGDQYISFISKLSSMNGNIKWTKTYERDNANTFIVDMHLANGVLLANCANTDIYNAANAFNSIHYIDTSNGTSLKAVKITYPQKGENLEYITKVIPLQDSGYYAFVERKIPISLQPGFEHINYFYRFNKYDSLLWAKSYTTASTWEWFYDAKRASNESLAMIGYERRTLLTPFYGSDDITLAKIDSAGNAFCVVSGSKQSISAFQLKEADLVWDNFTDYPLNLKSANIIINDAYPAFRYQCPDALVPCSLLKLEGPISVCDLKRSYTYKIHHNKNCLTQPVIKISDGAQIISQTDSSITLSFNSPGNYKIKASIDGTCLPLADSLFVVAAEALKKLSLGNDTTLCPGTTLLLNPGKFKNYFWQDSSIAKTFLVTEPGKYYVTVTDSCNNTLADTINIIYKNTCQVTCSAKYFNTSFHHLGSNGPNQILLLPTGSTLLTSAVSGGCNIIKVDTKGDTAWSKLYTLISTQGAYKLLLNNENYVIALMGEDLIKLDTNGNVLSSTSIHINNLPPKDIGLLVGGDIIVVFPSNGGEGAVLTRYTKDFNKIVWSRQLTIYESYFSNFIIDADKIILAGSASASQFSSDNNPFICSVDAESGNIINFKYYKTANTQSSINKLYKCGDGYLALAYLESIDPAEGSHCYLRFDDNLNLIAAKQIIGYTNSTDDYSFVFSPQSDGSFYAVFGSSFNLALFYIDKDDNVQWATDFSGYNSNPSDIKQNDEGLYITGGNNFYNVVTGGTESEYCLIKSDFNGKVGSCTPDEKVSVNTKNIQFTNGSAPSNTSAGNASLNTTTVETGLFLIDVSKTCAGESICNSIKLMGDTAICNSLSKQFHALKNKDCRSIVEWSVLPSANVITVINDSTISIQFTKSGNYTMHAFITTQCGKVEDSLVVHVNLSEKLNLGDDQFLCKDSSYIVHAGNQFKTYWWQDGSSDSNYTVTTSGKYYVSVTDYCNSEYIDTIVINPAPNYNFSAGNDTFKCTNDTLVLHATPGLLSYRWSPLYNITDTQSDIVTVYPEINTDYFVQAQTPYGCYVKDTVHIDVKNSIPLDIGNDTSLCDGDSIILMPRADFQSYYWNTGSTASQIVVKTPGIYSLSATDANECISKDSVTVNVFTNPKVHLPDDSILCYGQTKILDAGTNYPSYKWNTGSTSSQITVNAVGIYTVTVSDINGCIGTDTSIITTIAPLPSGFLLPDTSKCNYDTLLLKSNSNYASYVWSTGSIEPVTKIINDGIYWLQVTDSNNCSQKEYITVINKECYNAIYFPTAFTPNGDRLNDKFRPKVYGTLKKFYMVIYNRWGAKIFETNDWQKGWDGTVNQILQNNDTYVWMATYELVGSQPATQKGTLTIVK